MLFFILFIIALHIVCAVHAMRNGDIFPWLFFILTVPFAGCLAYIAVTDGPQMLRDCAGAARRLREMLDPTEDLRVKRDWADMVGSADAKRALAEECLRHDRYDEAVALFETAAMGLHADDPGLLYGLAHARFLNQDAHGAQAALDHLRSVNPNWSTPKAHLLYARALEQQGKDDEALDEYGALIDYYPGEEARCRMALLLKKRGRDEDARLLFHTVIHFIDQAPKHYREAERGWAKVAKRHLTF